MEAVLQDMIHKYERIKAEAKVQLCKEESLTKRRKLVHLKRIKTLEHHIVTVRGEADRLREQTVRVRAARGQQNAD